MILPPRDAISHIDIYEQNLWAFLWAERAFPGYKAFQFFAQAPIK
jgi:hypothetical protein